MEELGRSDGDQVLAGFQDLAKVVDDLVEPTDIGRAVGDDVAGPFEQGIGIPCRANTVGGKPQSSPASLPSFAGELT